MRTLKINNELVGYVGWDILDEINTRSQFSFTVNNKRGLTNINIGMYVEFDKDDVKLFRGYITSISDYEVSNGVVEYVCSATDNTILADWRVIADVIVGQSVYWIIVNKLMPILSEEGVTLGTVQGDDITVEKANYPYIPISDALNELAEIAGYIWYIDKDKKLNFHRRDEYISPINITSTTNVYGFNRTRQYGQYRNTEYTRAGLGETNLLEDLVPTPKPDGVSRTFVFSYPIAEKPVLYVNSVEVPSSDIGSLNVDTDKKWYWAYGSNVVTQSTDEIVLDSTDNLKGDIIGLYNIISIADNPDEIDNRKSIEGGTGKHEHLSVNRNINNNLQSLQYSQAQIALYADIPDSITFNIYDEGISAGQLININKPIFGIDESFLVKSVGISPYTHDKEVYTITCLDGYNFGGWDLFFKKLLGNGKNFIIGDNELVIVLSTSTESEGFGGTIYLNATAKGLSPSATLSHSATLSPSGGYTSEGVIND